MRAFRIRPTVVSGLLTVRVRSSVVRRSIPLFHAALRPTPEQLVRIRMAIGEFGTMLLATPRTVSIICEVLGIDRGVTVVYPAPLPYEQFGDPHNSVIVLHTGAAHFIPYDSLVPPREDDQPGQQPGGKKRVREKDDAQDRRDDSS